MTASLRTRRAAIAAALAAVYVLWGSTYLGIALAIETLPPLLMAALRFLFAGAILLAIARILGGPLRIARRDWLVAVASGVPLLLVGNGGVVWAQQRVPSGIAALVIATVPLWIAVLDRVVHGKRLGGRALVGLALGFGGIVLLVDPRGEGGADALGAAVLVLAALGWAAGTLVARDAGLPEQPLLDPSMQMLAGGAALVVAGALNGELSKVDPASFSARSLLGFAHLVVFGSLVAFSAYAWLLRNARTTLVATYAYVNPVVAVLLGWALLDEAVTGQMLLAGAVIVGAVVLIVSSGAAPERQRAAAGRRVRTYAAGLIRAR